MPRQNRVTPRSEIIAHPGRGLLMGNRGCLHDQGGRIVRDFRGERWIACLTAFRGRRRALMQPGRYTELFFLDEAVALAAGHRPCAECRRADYDRFCRAWRRADLPEARLASAMDRVLHQARLAGKGAPTPLAALPDGAFVEWQSGACLWHEGRLWPWAPGGYGAPRPLAPAPAPATATSLPVLTPAPVLAVLAAGYRPLLHASAGPRRGMSESDKPGARD